MRAQSFQAMLDTFNHIPPEFVDEQHPGYRSDRDVQRAFDDYLDDCEPPVTVAGIRFWPSQILKECDPIAYDQAFSEYSDLSNQLWVNTPDGWLIAGEVDNIVDAWEMLTDEEQNKFLSPADRDDLCPDEED